MFRSVSFSVPGAIPPKSNYRKSSSKASRDLWTRIKSYEKEVGKAAMVAGARRHMGRGKVWLRVRLVNQACDLDNALKCPVSSIWLTYAVKWCHIRMARRVLVTPPDPANTLEVLT